MIAAAAGLLFLSLASGSMAASPEDRLFEAVRKGNASAVRALLSKGVAVNARDKESNTPLHEAIYSGYPGIAALLIRNGADVAARQKSGMTPLHLVAVHTKREDAARLAKLLIDMRADVNDGAENGWTPLHAALFHRQDEMVKLLVERGADVNAQATNDRWGPPLSYAISSGAGTDILELLVRNGANVNAAGPGRITPLHKAAGGGYTAAVKLLLANGADPDARNEDQWTPLEDALHYRHSDRHREAGEILAFAQGLSATRRQDWPAAIKAFEKGYELAPPPPPAPLLLNLGLAESRLAGRELRAMAWLRLYLHYAPDAANAAAVRQEIATLKTRVNATLDGIAGRMLELAMQFPDEEQRRRACGFVALTQARAGRFREARATAETDACAGKALPNVIVGVLKQIADCMSNAGEFEEAYGAIRNIGSPSDRFEALLNLIDEQAWAGDCSLAKRSVERAIADGVLSAVMVDDARRKAADCPRKASDGGIWLKWNEITPKPGMVYDVRTDIAAVATRESPEKILEGLMDISGKIYGRMLGIENAGR
jgi:ankyrin repeat protein